MRVGFKEKDARYLEKEKLFRVFPQKSTLRSAYQTTKLYRARERSQRARAFFSLKASLSLLFFFFFVLSLSLCVSLKERRVHLRGLALLLIN
jgi:hypothetical protein